MKKLIFLLVLGSCASTQVTNYYWNYETIDIAFEDKNFLVKDDPVRKSALVMEGFGRDLGKVIGESLSFGLIDLTDSVRLFEGALQNYLNTYKDGECFIVRSNFIPDGFGAGTGYEIFYTCS